MKDDKNENNEKEVQYYAQTVAAWFNTRLEHDKSLLTLSAGGIALLITLLTTVGVKSVEGLVLYVCSVISFIVCLVSVLFIFIRNSEYLENVIKNNTPTDPVLITLDRIAMVSFLFGVLMAAILGISAATKSFLNAEVKMSSENKNQKVERVQESFNGAAGLRPQSSDETRSFNGAQSLRPTSQQQGQTEQGNSSNQNNDSNEKNEP